VEAAAAAERKKKKNQSIARALGCEGLKGGGKNVSKRYF